LDSNGGTREQLLEAQIAAQADFAEKDRLYQDIKHTLEVSSFCVKVFNTC
jgi:hypothetical protein